MIVKLKKDSAEYPDLSAGQPYFVIGIEADDYRILNDAGKPFLYPACLFKVADASEPDDWVTEYGEDGERYAYPEALNAVGFFEDFFDNNQEKISTFWHVVNRRLTDVA